MILRIESNSNREDRGYESILGRFSKPGDINIPSYYSYAKYTGSSYKKGSGKWEYKTTTAPLSKTKVVGGRQQYSGYWYNQETSTKEVNTTVIYYRYRDLNSK